MAGCVYLFVKNGACGHSSGVRTGMTLHVHPSKDESYPSGVQHFFRFAPFQFHLRKTEGSDRGRGNSRSTHRLGSPPTNLPLGSSSRTAHPKSHHAFLKTSAPFQQPESGQPDLPQCRRAGEQRGLVTMKASSFFKGALLIRTLGKTNTRERSRLARVLTVCGSRHCL